MLRLTENYKSVDEELDFAKQDFQKKDGGSTHRLWITGTKPEMDFLYAKFLAPRSGNKFWFNSEYNPNPPVSSNGEKCFLPPITPAKGSDGNWTYFTWKVKNPEFVEHQIRAIQMFIRDVNVALGEANNIENAKENANPKLDAFLTKLEQIRDFIEAEVVPNTELPESREAIKTKLSQFLSELANAVDDADLIKQVGDYLAFASVFSYSFLNTFLIYLQDRNATEVLSKGKWAILNMQPKSPQYLMGKYGQAGAIGLWTPVTASRGNASEIAAEKNWRERYLPNRPMPSNPSAKDIFYNKAVSQTGLSYTQKLSMDSFVKKMASSMVGGGGWQQFKMRYNFLDKADVEQMADKPVADRPEQPSWYTSEPDEKADHIYELVVSVIKKLGLNFAEKADMGGSRGSASQSGDINLLAGNAGIGRASTATHELAHALTHQTFLTKKSGVDAKIAKGEKLTELETIISNAYKGRDNTETLELQAEGTAFVVLRYFGIPEDKLKHSANYIRLWRNDKAAVEANFEIISTTSKSIIALMKKEMGGTSDDAEIEDVGSVQEQVLSFLRESIIFNNINQTLNKRLSLTKLIT